MVTRRVIRRPLVSWSYGSMVHKQAVHYRVAVKQCPWFVENE